MNIPSSIKGFQNIAPEFPYIKGLPLIPLMTAMIEMLKERIFFAVPNYMQNRPFSTYDELWQSPLNGISITPTFAAQFDSAISNICQYFQDDYDTAEHYGGVFKRWTPYTLALQASRILGIENIPIGETSSILQYVQNLPMAIWAIHRCTMLSLLKNRIWRDKYTSSNITTCRYWIKYHNMMSYSHGTWKEVYDEALLQYGQDIRRDIGYESIYGFNDTQGIRQRCDEIDCYTMYGFRWVELRLLDSFQVDFSQSEYLNGDFVFNLFTYKPDINDLYDPFGLNYPEAGQQTIPVTIQSDGTFFSLPGVRYSQAYPNNLRDGTEGVWSTYAWASSPSPHDSYLVGNYSDHFTYQLTWDES